jgi:hypothetical protein
MKYQVTSFALLIRQNFLTFKIGKKFNHSVRSWLVLWEAKVVVQLPPWVIVLYPSSLIYHFNVDINGK